MATLTLEYGIKKPDETYTGRTKAAALKLLRAAMEKADDDALDGTTLSVAYKEERKIVREDGKWYFVASENGCGESRECKDRAEAIDKFLFACSEKGEHWD